jgi:predicted ATPase
VFLGLWRFYVTRADIGVAREMSDQLRLLADPEGKPTSRVLAHFTLGWTALVGGDIEVAEAEAAAGFDLYRPEQRCAPAYRIGHDPGTGCAIYAAFARWLLGHPDQARGGVGDAMGLAGVVAHPFSEAHASLWGSIIAQLLADPQTVEERAAATAAIATEQQYALWAAGADVMRGWALAARGQGAEGLERMRRGVVEWQVCGARLLLPYFLGLMADIQHALGQNENATTMLGEALQRVAGTGERWFEAELHRLKGAFLLAQSPAAVGEAEASLRQALAIARQQGARSLELRAAHDLARLWAEQGERQKALELLAPVYGWFTEGFDTPDLKHAKALLDELA